MCGQQLRWMEMLQFSDNWFSIQMQNWNLIQIQQFLLVDVPISLDPSLWHQVSKFDNYQFDSIFRFYSLFTLASLPQTVMSYNCSYGQFQNVITATLNCENQNPIVNYGTSTLTVTFTSACTFSQFPSWAIAVIVIGVLLLVVIIFLKSKFIQTKIAPFRNRKKYDTHVAN